jgi:hypothetical protein
MRQIKVFYHLTDLPGWETITNEQLNLLESSGLLDAADDIYFNLHYKESSFTQLKARYATRQIVHWIFRNPKKDDFEHTTYCLMRDITGSATYPFNALYFHQKGITKLGTPQENPTRDWRRLMDFWNIEKWELCNFILNNGVDAVSCLLTPNPQDFQYLGTTRWITSEFLWSLPELKLPSQIGYAKQLSRLPEYTKYRYEIESVLTYSSKKILRLATLYNKSKYDGYSMLLPRSEYETHYDDLVNKTKNIDIVEIVQHFYPNRN